MGNIMVEYIRLKWNRIQSVDIDDDEHEHFDDI